MTLPQVIACNKTHLGIIARVMAAILGGYILANLISMLLSYLLPVTQAQAVLTSMLASYAIYAAVVMWVFSVKTATKAWAGLLITSALMATMVFILNAASKL